MQKLYNFFLLWWNNFRFSTSSGTKRSWECCYALRRSENLFGKNYSDWFCSYNLNKKPFYRFFLKNRRYCSGKILGSWWFAQIRFDFESVKLNWFWWRLGEANPIPTSLTLGAKPFLRSCQLRSYSRISQHFVEPEGSLPCRPQECIMF
jgi:hypothetical protein